MSDRDVAARLSALHRYTITSEGAPPGYFRLVEDPDGCWVQWPEVAGLLTALPRQFVEQKEDTDHSRGDVPCSVDGRGLPQRAPVLDWQPIEHVQPEDDQSCLVWRQWPGRIAVHTFQRRQRPAWTWEGLYGWEPTHWMPLPSPPSLERTPNAIIAVARIDGTQHER